MNCGRVSNQLSAYIDRELTGVEMLHVRRHLDDCDRCRSEYEALCRMKTLLGGLRTAEPGPDFVAGTLRRWQGQQALGGRRSPAARRRALAAGRFRIEALSRWRLPSETWRLSLGLSTAVLAAGLVLTSLFLHRPRHADALVATSPIAVLEGQDPLNRPSGGEWKSLDTLPSQDWRPRGTGSSLSLNFKTVSFPDDDFRTFR
jgi:anti-sigma factor RsiW